MQLDAGEGENIVAKAGVLSTTPCCGSEEHLGCSVLEVCRRCNTNLKVLACVVCHDEIDPPDATADDAYHMAGRMPCCFAD